jgi:hypothetical protein
LVKPPVPTMPSDGEMSPPGTEEKCLRQAMLDSLQRTGRIQLGMLGSFSGASGEQGLTAAKLAAPLAEVPAQSLPMPSVRSGRAPDIVAGPRLNFEVGDNQFDQLLSEANTLFAPGPSVIAEPIPPAASALPAISDITEPTQLREDALSTTRSAAVAETSATQPAEKKARFFTPPQPWPEDPEPMQEDVRSDVTGLTVPSQEPGADVGAPVPDKVQTEFAAHAKAVEDRLTALQLSKAMQQRKPSYDRHTQITLPRLTNKRQQ